VRSNNVRDAGIRQLRAGHHAFFLFPDVGVDKINDLAGVGAGLFRVLRLDAVGCQWQ
jgi:hypothetical protein